MPGPRKEYAHLDPRVHSLPGMQYIGEEARKSLGLPVSAIGWYGENDSIDGYRSPFGTKAVEDASFTDGDGNLINQNYSNNPWAIRPVTKNGVEYTRTGKPDADFLNKEMREVLARQGISDPGSLVQYDPEEGFLFPSAIIKQLTPMQVAANGEGWSGMLPGLFMAAATAGIGAYAAGAGAVAGGAAGGATGAGASFTGSAFADAVLQKAAMGALSSGVSGGNPLTGALTGGLTAGLNSFLPSSFTGMSGVDSLIKAGIGGGLSSAIKGGNPLTGALGGAVSKGLGGALRLFDSNPLDTSDAGGGATLSSVNPLADLRGGSNMWDDIYEQFMGGTPLDLDPPIQEWDAGTFEGPTQDQLDALMRQELFGDPTQDQLQNIWAQNLGALNPDGSINWAAIDKQIQDPNSSIYMGSLDGAPVDPGGSLGGLSGLSGGLAKLLGLGTGTGAGGVGGAGGLPSWLTGKGGDSLFGDGGLLGLSARLAPGMAALGLAQSQNGADTSPLSNLIGNSSGIFNSPLDTSQLSVLDCVVE